MNRDGSNADGTALSLRAAAKPVARRYVLEVIEGVDAGRSFSLDAESSESRALLGQGPACTLALTDKAVSRRHAALG